MVAKLSDVAALAGVSVTTVSRVINSYGSLSQKTIDKVHAAMRELHYQPNAMARSLKGKSSQFIGLILPNMENPFFTALANEIEQLLFLKGYKVIIAASANNVEKEQQYLQMLAANQVEGIITSSHNLDIEEYQNTYLPIVSYDRYLSDDIPIVSEDNEEGGYLAGKYLLSTGARRLLILSDDDGSKSPTHIRYDGFLRATKDSSAKVFQENFNLEGFASKEDLDKMINYVIKDDIDGVFAYNDVGAIQLQNALRKIGKRVPEDVKIIGYDGTPIVRQLHPDLPTVVQPVKQAAKVLIDVLFAVIENPGEKPQNNELLGVELFQPE
ncbi:LacI family DNA-binding transcriptional regulator [Leuconostoc mesenteroides]|uniref:LacI family DNA-binding transcriptional regulator n=1 Tax=Leuconostoc mesenteroides TaxID=1245 RepID=UPI000E094A90|nr:LacI family DNA-binding transcriptional regulator [Leuconostoc mesenteroides]MCJ2160102.1 LacI family DNA-binding transcriptional regulator [Leuconostoc mesenteroides]MCM6835018.1 LacI family DNA-binding transcriptional regulator [Leuconostoc mesenteroides]RDG15353.1 LacI family transcriptional regulator [Leuconostoc mesenteroides subsp. mesenteroides]